MDRHHATFDEACAADCETNVEDFVRISDDIDARSSDPHKLLLVSSKPIGRLWNKNISRIDRGNPIEYKQLRRFTSVT